MIICVLVTIDSGTDGMLIGDNPAIIKAGISSILLKTGNNKNRLQNNGSIQEC
ncbi:hypothetical protein [Tenacibaculum sp.]|uniref:hypothetical protein n=1 Tax=Tenacibaculum sp. TaxID=1906242 RepID=UPI003D125F47